jgi:hypothetical protein
MIGKLSCKSTDRFQKKKKQSKTQSPDWQAGKYTNIPFLNSPSKINYTYISIIEKIL